MIGRCSYSYFIVPEGKRKLPLSEKLFVLPSFIVIINAHAWKELSNGVDVVSIFRKEFHPATLTKDTSVNDVKRPFDSKGIFFARTERLGQVHPHHGIVDRK